MDIGRWEKQIAKEGKKIRSKIIWGGRKDATDRKKRKKNLKMMMKRRERRCFQNG